jgi:amino acid transporter
MGINKKIFLREATGLRKELSTIDAFGINLLTVNIGLGIVFLAFLAPASFPGGDMFFGTILTTIGSLIFALTWGYLAASMPRLGGDYVYVSRILHPLLGFISNWSVVFFSWLFDVVAIYYFVTGALSPSLYALGYLANSPAIDAIASGVTKPLAIFVIGVTIIGIVTVIILISTKAFLYVIRGIWVVGVIGAFLSLVVLLTTSPARFITVINDYALKTAGVDDYYSKILQSGLSGFEPVHTLSFATIQIIPLAFFSLGYAFYSSYVGSEIRNAPRAQLLGMSLSVVVSGIFIALLALAFEKALTYKFLYALTNTYFSNPTMYALPSPPYINFFAILASNNVLLGLLIMLGFLAWGVIWVGMGTFLQPRNMMAWSFDRIAPAFLGRVHERFNTPHIGIIISFIGHFVLFLLTFVIGSFILGLSAVTGNVLFTFIPIGLTAMLFPYRRADIFSNQPPYITKRIGKVPVITVLGLVSLLFILLNGYLFLVYPAYGANSIPSLEVIAGIVLLGVVWFYAFRTFRIRQGLDVFAAFREIPPE